MWETTFKQDHNQKIKHRADWFKPFWETKKGHWKLIYPGIDEIEGLNCMLTVECLECGLVFNQWGNNLGRWMKHGAKGPACSKNGELPPDAVRIRKACIEARITYLEIGEKANYSESRVRNIANGILYNEETAKCIADIAEKMVKDKRKNGEVLDFCQLEK